MTDVHSQVSKFASFFLEEFNSKISETTEEHTF
jgi:hypothetical protein